MLSPPVRMARDYNRSLAAPIRAVHIVAAAAHDTLARHRSVRTVLLPLALGVVGFLVVLPWDRAINAGATRLAESLPGDVRREWFAWQQYGQGFCLIIVALGVILLDTARTRRLLDLALAAAACSLVANGLKLLVGRPRPRPEFDDPITFLGPLGKYPILIPGKAPSDPGAWRLTTAWDSATGGGADLWSMPSSHTMFAAMLSVFLGAMYPRLRPLLVGLTALVALGRVTFDAHWMTDVIVGAMLGVAIAAPIVSRFAGVALLDMIWRALVDRSALPALPRVMEAELAHRIGR